MIDRKICAEIFSIIRKEGEDAEDGVVLCAVMMRAFSKLSETSSEYLLSWLTRNVDIQDRMADLLLETLRETEQDASHANS